VLVFRRYLPEHVAATRHYRERHGHRTIATFVAADYAGAIFSGAVPLVLPLSVLSVAGAAQNAYFYVSWVVATAVMTLASNLAAALTVEAAHDKDSLALLTRKLVSRAVRLGAPILLVLLAVPSLVLAMFGPDYGQMYGYGTGLSAFLTKLLVQRSTRPAVLGRIPTGLVKIARIRLDTGRRLTAGTPAPRGMLRREFAGYVAGPLLYAQARRRVRRGGPATAHRDPAPAPAPAR
jgi:hypothetical protein